MRKRSFGSLACFLLFSALTTPLPLSAQGIVVEKELRLTGVVRNIKPGQISIVTESGEVHDCKVQNKNEEALMIAGQPIRVPAKIKVNGKLKAQLIEKGMVLQFESKATETGKTETPVETVTLAGLDQTLEANFLERPAKGEAGRISIVGRVINTAKQKLYLQVPDAKWSRGGRIDFLLSENCTLDIETDHLNPVRVGDQVKASQVHLLSNGEKVIREISIFLSADRTSFYSSYHDKLEQQFRHLSDEPVKEPRQLSSDYFLLHTDLSDRSANILLAKLNTMYELIARYFGKRPNAIIECYVVKDLNKWQKIPLPPEGLARIQEKAGVTMSTTLPSLKQTKSVVYSCESHGVCQHEAVHAFCAMTFGSTGPVWYSEGMAELGQYWKPGELAVDIDPVVIEFLANANPPKSLAEIIAPGQITGDSWEAYAWRWALCHLLANNPGYRKQFHGLGVTMMLEGEKSRQNFETSFGKYQDRISFEYDLFVKHLGNGYRVDLCAWDWSVKPAKLTSAGRLKQEVKAAAGWQPTKLLATKGVTYEYVAEGKWKTSPIGTMVDAEGEKKGRGRLVGVLLKDYQLQGPFDLGKRGSFVAPGDGQLYLRCKDEWTELADNEGAITVHLRRKDK